MRNAFNARTFTMHPQLMQVFPYTRRSHALQAASLFPYKPLLANGTPDSMTFLICALISWSEILMFPEHFLQSVFIGAPFHRKHYSTSTSMAAIAQACAFTNL
jgi:hypothetical protein